jgi:hypothetical protein
MPNTNAERQRAWRQRQSARLATLEAEAAQLRAELHDARTDLAAAHGEAERLASTACRHPAAAIDRRDGCSNGPLCQDRNLRRRTHHGGDPTGRPCS